MKKLFYILFIKEVLFMRDMDLNGIIVFSILAGGICTFLGGIIKSFNGADMLNYFDEKRYDKDKTSKLVGLDFLIIGLSILFLAFISVFINPIYYNLIVLIDLSILFIGYIIAFYHQFFVCRKKDIN